MTSNLEPPEDKICFTARKPRPDDVPLPATGKCNNAVVLYLSTRRSHRSRPALLLNTQIHQLLQRSRRFARGDSIPPSLLVAPAAILSLDAEERRRLMMYNVMYRMMFDRRFESVKDELFIKLSTVNRERSQLAQSFDYNYGDFIPILRPFLKKYLARCQALKDKRLAIFKEYFIDERKKVLAAREAKRQAGEKVAIDFIFESEQKGEINDDNVLYIVENINVAAIETTLWSIEWGVAELCNNPHMLKRIRAELDSKLGRGNLITEPDIPRCEYLTAFVKEVMRLHMAIPLLVPHMNLNKAKLAGYDIPAESKILVNAWWIANNPKYWNEPEKFNPDRFMDESIEATGADFRFLPFGAGRRSCPGIIVAMPLLHLVLGRLVQTFDFSPPPGVDKIDMTEKGGQFSLFIKNHYNIVVTDRKD